MEGCNPPSVILGLDPRIGCGPGWAPPLTQCGGSPGPRVKPEGDANQIFSLILIAALQPTLITLDSRR